MSGGLKNDSHPGVAIIGTGYWGKNLVRVFDQLGVLVAVCDSAPGQLARLVLSDGVRRCHSVESILAEPSVNAVVIATPAATHYELARSALAAGKDVLVEKPMALKKAQAQELVDLANRQDRILMVGHILRYHPAVLKLQAMIEAGELGRIEYIYASRLNMGKLRTEENILWSFAPHDISVILGLMGEQPVAVSAHGAAFLQRDVSDVTLTTIEFANGIRAYLFVSWLHPFKEQRLVVVGSEQMTVFEDSRPDEKLVCYPHRVEWHRGKIPVAVKGEPRVLDFPEAEPLRLECEHFLESVATRIPPRTDGAEGVRVVEVLNAAEESLRRNGRVVVLTDSSKNKVVKSEPTLTSGVEPASRCFIHPTAVVDQGVQIGAGTKIWHFSHIAKNCRIGRNCTFGQNVFVAEGVTVGDNCKVQNNVSLYKGVVLEAGVFCGPSCVFTNVIDPRAFIEKKAEFRPTLVKEGASIGANATVVCGHTLGRYCLIGAGAVVTSDVPDYALMMGVPARQHGWVCKCGKRLQLEDGRAYCQCGSEYWLQGNRLRPVSELVTQLEG